MYAQEGISEREAKCLTAGVRQGVPLYYLNSLFECQKLSPKFIGSDLSTEEDQDVGQFLKLGQLSSG